MGDTGAVIRAAGPGDAEELVGAYEWLFAPPGVRPPEWEPDAAARRLRSACAGQGSLVLVAEDVSGIVGLCTVYLDIESVRFGLRAWVEDLAVSPERRSQRIGKRLLDAAKDWARAHGATHLELDSGAARHDAHRFYEREGAKEPSLSFGWRLS